MDKLGQMRRLVAVENAEAEHADALAGLQAKFAELRPVVERVAAGDYSSKALSNVSTYVAEVDAAAHKTTDLYSTMTQTTTKTPIFIMLPLPLTSRQMGGWQPGNTMEVAVKIAEQLINEEQKLLPGYRLAADVFDDHCDDDLARRAMLQRYAASQDWIGIGGMGCASVCKALGIIGDALFLPVVSFECSQGEELSNQNEFPTFMRMGTRQQGMYQVVSKLRDQFGWTSLVIVHAGDTASSSVGQVMECRLSGHGEVCGPPAPAKAEWAQESAVRSSVFEIIKRKELPFGSIEAGEAVAAMTEQMSSAVGIMRAIKEEKDRLVFFIGPERQFRFLICASHVAAVHPGLTWISEGVKARSWWAETDEQMMALPGISRVDECTSDLIGSLYEGGINIAGLGSPLEAELDEPLDCFKGHTSRSLHSHISERLAEGYATLNDPNGTPVLHPHDDLINQVVDGMCSFSMMVRYMLFNRGRTIKQLKDLDKVEYNRVVQYMKTSLNYRGASGHVKMSGNDLNNYLAVYQASGNSSHLAGYILAEETDRADSIDGLAVSVNLSWSTGLMNNSWEEAPADAAEAKGESFPILAVVIPVLVLFFCAIICYAIFTSRRVSGGSDKNSNLA